MSLSSIRKEDSPRPGKEVKIFGEGGKREYTRDIVVLTGFLDNEKLRSS
jgi:hypothetical protein